MDIAPLRSPEDLEEAVLSFGFLPFFRNSISGFSVEEMCDRRLWFSPDVDGPWEWKGPVVRRCKVAYGKFYGGKAMYVSRRFFPDFVQLRRSRRPEAAICPFAEAVLAAVAEEGSLLSPQLKTMFGAFKPRRRQAGDLVDLTGLADTEYKLQRNALERALTALQMSTDIVIQDFEYPHTKDGRSYGWGLARYTTPEALFGASFIDDAMGSTPEESAGIIMEHLRTLLPATPETLLRKLI